MSVTAITPTGDRPLAFALCQHWMERQTQRPDQWLVVDDGAVPVEPFVSMDYVRRPPVATDPKHTLVQNLAAALPLVRCDKVIIMEDDEYYAPAYVARMAQALDGHEVAGIMDSRYYHLPSGKYAMIGNSTHASLAETAFRKSFIPALKVVMGGDSYLDMRLWQAARPKPGAFLFRDLPTPLYLGIKGLPGRAGIGAGHSTHIYRAQDTPARTILQSWVPGDWAVYMDVINGVLTTGNCRAYFQWA